MDGIGFQLCPSAGHYLTGIFCAACAGTDINFHELVAFCLQRRRPTRRAGSSVVSPWFHREIILRLVLQEHLAPKMSGHQEAIPQNET